MKTNQRLRRNTIAGVLAGAAVIALCACIPQKTLKDHTQRLSYSIGLQIGKGLDAQHIVIDTALFMRGLNDARNGNKPLMPLEQVRQNIDVLLSEKDLQHTDGNSRTHTTDLFPVDVFSSKIINELPDQARIAIDY